VIKLKALLANLLAILAHIFTINDIFIAVGLAVATRGIMMLSESGAWIFAGLFFLGYGLWGVYVRQTSKGA